MQSHTGCICLTFPHCAFSNVSLNCLPVRMHIHTGCICLTLIHCVFLNVSLNRLLVRMHSHIGCICLTFLHCVFSNVSSNYWHKRLHNHIGCTFLNFYLGHILLHFYEVLYWHCLPGSHSVQDFCPSLWETCEGNGIAIVFSTIAVPLILVINWIWF